MKILLVVLSVFVLTSCSPTTTTAVQQPLAISGETLIAVGQQFVDVANLYNAQCVHDVKPAMTSFCAQFRTFAPKFKTGYPLAVSLWQTARRTNDTAAAKTAGDAILELATGVTSVGLLGMQTIGGK